MPRHEAPVSKPVVLTIAGSDSGGGAGIQADLKTIEACGGFGTSAITSVTAQNTTGVESTHLLPLEEIEAQCEAVKSDFDLAAVKTGMLATRDVVEFVAETVRGMAAPVVVDPVMVAASGDRLLAPEAESAYEQLLAEATLVTPNADEAAVLTGIDPETEDDAIAAGERLVEMGAEAALVKGGHLPGEEVVDVLVTRETAETFRHDRIETDATHGSGCTLSSAIATHLARGADLSEAVGAGVALLARAVRYNHDLGEGPGAVHHLVETRRDSAKREAAETVDSVVAALVDGHVEDIVPDSGMNVIGATEHAETRDEVAGVDGRITRTASGVRPNRGIRYGVTTEAAQVLLAAREVHPELRYAVHCSHSSDIEEALYEFDGTVIPYESSGDTAVSQSIRQACEAFDERPVALVEPGNIGGEATSLIVASDPETLVERTLAVAESLDE
jgi:hydroxymethylpyrimidine kinase/phosphomethylpyrimidine kinase